MAVAGYNAPLLPWLKRHRSCRHAEGVGETGAVLGSVLLQEGEDRLDHPHRAAGVDLVLLQLGEVGENRLVHQAGTAAPLGKPQAMAQWRGKVLVVNYWASWCAPCVEEMPAFSRLQEKYAARGVQFVGIGIDDAEKMQAFVRRTPVAYPLLVGDAAGSQTPALQVRGLPTTVVIDRDGRLEGSRLGRLDEATLEPILLRLMAH